MLVKLVPREFRIMAAATFATIIFYGLISALPFAAAVSAQDNIEPIAITERGCDFDFDRNSDGEPDGSFDPKSIRYLPQDTPVLGRCFFQVTTTSDAVIEFESQLNDWAGVGTKEKVARQLSETIEVDAGKSEVTISAGGSLINIDLSGNTPRGYDRKDLPEGYKHDVQVPREFRLINIKITTDAGDSEWVVTQDISSASNAYIEADHAIIRISNDLENPLPPAVLQLGKQLLQEGYPEIAVRVTNLEFPTDSKKEERKILPLWVWWIVVVVVVVLVIGVAGFVILRRKQNSQFDEED